MIRPDSRQCVDRIGLLYHRICGLKTGIIVSNTENLPKGQGKVFRVRTRGIIHWILNIAVSETLFLRKQRTVYYDPLFSVLVVYGSCTAETA